MIESTVVILSLLIDAYEADRIGKHTREHGRLSSPLDERPREVWKTPFMPFTMHQRGINFAHVF